MKDWQVSLMLSCCMIAQLKSELTIPSSPFFRAQPYPVRRARGYAPNPIRLADLVPQVLAVGPQMKNTICLTREKYAFLSHYIGEMENWETYQDFKGAIDHYQSLFRITPEVIAHDLHPDYLSTQYALERAERDGLPAIGVQHHHAHLAAAALENQVPPEEQVAGLIFDGTGFGTDGTIWGGEVLVGNCDTFTRPYHLQPLPLPGGEVTIRKPARMALSLLWALGMPWGRRSGTRQGTQPNGKGCSPPSTGTQHQCPANFFHGTSVRCDLRPKRCAPGSVL